MFMSRKITLSSPDQNPIKSFYGNDLRYRLRIINTILEERNKFGWLTRPTLKTYYKTTTIKTAWYWQKNRQMNSLKSPEIDSHKYSQLIFDNGAKAMQ